RVANGHPVEPPDGWNAREPSGPMPWAQEPCAREPGNGCDDFDIATSCQGSELLPVERGRERLLDVGKDPGEYEYPHSRRIGSCEPRSAKAHARSARRFESRDRGTGADDSGPGSWTETARASCHGPVTGARW